MYKLAHRLQKARNEDLWLAIVALTEHHLRQFITTEVYQR